MTGRLAALRVFAALLAVLAPMAGAGVVGADDGAAETNARSGNASGTQSTGPGVCAGRISQPADAVTVISVQGAKFSGEDAGKKPARLVGVAPDGEVLWVEKSGNGSWARERGYDPAVWGYDVDPLANGNVFVTNAGRVTNVYESNPRTGERVWTETLPYHDTHDVDLLPNGNLVVANMRNSDEAAGTNDDRVFVYNRTTDEIVWEWRFADHYERFRSRPKGTPAATTPTTGATSTTSTPSATTGSCSRRGTSTRWFW